MNHVDNFKKYLIGIAPSISKEDKVVVDSLKKLLPLVPQLPFVLPIKHSKGSVFEVPIKTEPSLEDLEAIYIAHILKKYGNKTKAAKVLGLGRTTLWRKIEQHKLQEIIGVDN